MSKRKALLKRKSRKFESTKILPHAEKWSALYVSREETALLIHRSVRTLDQYRRRFPDFPKGFYLDRRGPKVFFNRADVIQWSKRHETD